MTAGQQLERSVLESKERDELHAIAQAMSLKTTSRTKKADIIDQILEATGVTAGNGSVNGEGPDAVAPNGTGASRRARGTAGVADEGSGEPEPDVAADAEPGAGAADDAPGTASVTANGSGDTGTEGTGFDRLPAGERGQGPGRSGDRPGQGNQQRPGNQQSRQQHANQPGNVEAGNRRGRRRRGRERGAGGELQGGANQEAAYQGELVEVSGLLDLRDEGYGFLRCDGYLPSNKDVYVSISQARRFALRQGDYIEGACRPASNNEKYPALLRIDTVSGLDPEEARLRPRFEDLTPLFPDSRLVLERPGDKDNVAVRIVDLLSPIGKGQRGMIVSPPKAGKTTVVKQIAHSIEANNPEVHLMVLLVDERPEEVTDMRRSVRRRGRGLDVRPPLRRAHLGRRAGDRAGQAPRRAGPGRGHHPRRHHPAGPGLQPGRTGHRSDHVRRCRLGRPLPAQEVLRRRPEHRRGRAPSPSWPRLWWRPARRWTR